MNEKISTRYHLLGQRLLLFLDSNIPSSSNIDRDCILKCVLAEALNMPSNRVEIMLTAKKHLTEDKYDFFFHLYQDLLSACRDMVEVSQKSDAASKN